MTPTAPSLSKPHEVSPFEYNLLRILRFMLGQFPADQGLQLLRTTMTRPGCLSTVCVRLVEDSLSKGCVLFLTRNGAWRNDRYLREGKPTEGRVWERIPFEERVLAFSPVVLEFLTWATAAKLPETKSEWNPPADGLTAADELFLFLAFDACRAEPEILEVLRTKLIFHSNPLCWLACPGDIADNIIAEPPPFEESLRGERAVILESLQPFLATRWLRSERAKGLIGDWGTMRHQGRAEFVALRSFLEAAERAGRTDLGRFVLKVNAALFATELTPAFWTGGLQGSGPSRLAERLDTRRAALAVPRQIEVLERWQERARNVGYFDEEYAASQAWKADWEAANGDTIAERARNAIAALEPLQGTSG